MSYTGTACDRAERLFEGVEGENSAIAVSTCRRRPFPAVFCGFAGDLRG